MFWPGVVLMVFLIGTILVGWMLDLAEIIDEQQMRDDLDW